MIGLWLVGSALAVDVDRFPVVAAVDLPETGAARVHLTPELRSALDPADGSDLLLVDATGRAVPFARLTDGVRWEALAPPVTGVATSTPMVWTVNVGPTPIDGLRVELARDQAAATVTLEDVAGRRLSEPTMVWRLAGEREEIVPLLREASGRLRVRVMPHTEGLMQAPDVVGVRLTDPGVEPDRLRWAVSEPRSQDNGWWRVDLALDRPLPLRSVELHPLDRVVQRRVGLQAASLGDPAGVLPWQVSPSQPTSIQRIALQGVVVEHLDVPLAGAPSDRLTLLIEDGSGPLLLDEVTLELPGVHLLVHDAGPGPHLLYAGAVPGTTPAWDLGAATPELARAARTPLEPGTAGPNPEWIPPETRGELGAPGRELEDTGFTWSRSVQGAGLSRIGLPLQVLAESREDLGDLRLQADGREVPYLLRRHAAELPVLLDGWETHTRGGETVLEIPVADPQVPLSSVTLWTDAPVFSRRVSVARVRGGELEYVRATHWTGDGGPSELTLELGQRIGDTLVVTLHDGDNPPLPLTDVTLRAPSWELVAAIPEDGEVRLLTGDSRRTSPSYDLALVAAELRQRPLADATLGERAPIAMQPLSWLDRLFVAGGLGVLAVGLLGLLAEVLRRPPTPTETPAA